MASGYKFTYNNATVDLSDVYMEKYYFSDYNGGYLVTWGSNTFGELGDNTSINRSSPIQTLSKGSNWKTIDGGGGHIVSIKSDGTLWLWGTSGYSGALGNNLGVVRRSSPVQTVASGTNWSSVDASAYGFGGSGLITAAIKADGALWAWGGNATGMLGDNTTVNKSSPIQIGTNTNWSQVSCGYRFMSAVKTDGTLWAWGENDYGQLGDNTIARKSSPIQTVAGGSTWNSVACGSFHAIATKTDGTLWCWGRNSYAQLGDNSTVPKSSPVQTVAGGTNWGQISGGWGHSAALKTDGTLWLWGTNSFSQQYGQLGTNSTTGRSSPVQTVAGGSNWKQISCGAFHTTAIKTNGTLWTWGRNDLGQLGDSTVVDRSSPVQTISSGSTYKYVAAGWKYTAAIIVP